MLDRPDYIETFVRHAASMVLGPWQENPPAIGTHW
jgi:hypothetical protein